MNVINTNVLIIGAGVYGIGLANHLYGQKRSFVIAGKFMDLWRNHTFENMELRSDFSTSEITHPENRFSSDLFLRDHPEFEIYRNKHLPVIVYRAYLNWVENNLEYPVINDLIENLDFCTGNTSKKKFCAVLKINKNTMIYSNKVVIASGLSHHLFIPLELNQIPENVIHSYESRKIEKLGNIKVLVVGGGQSAAESIEVLIKKNNDVSWLSRHSTVYLEQPVNISTWLFSMIIKSSGLFYRCPSWLRKFIILLLSRPTIRPGFKPILEKVTKTDHVVKSSHMIYSKIISATGFKYKLDNYTFLSSKIKLSIKTAHNIPILDKSFQSTLRGVYFTGGIAETRFGTALKFIIGSHYACKNIAKNLFD